MIPSAPPPGERPAPRYSAIERALADAIGAARLPPGTVLTEEPLARLFGTSRTPVRTALAELEARGLLGRFEGRGYVVAGGPPRRLRLTRDLLGLPDPPSAPQPGSAERIARDFEAAIASALPFGLYRISEQAVADHYGVSRTVVRELLSRLQDRGLVRKDLRSHWVVGPLTARDVGHYFSIRRQLEPLALTDSAPRMPAAEIRAMWQRLEAAMAEAPDALQGRLAAERIAALEEDIHIRLLARSPNPHLLRMIHQSQIALTVNSVFASFVGARPFGLALREHAIVLEFVMRGAHQAAAAALEEHLRLSAERTRQRLMAISVFPRPELPAYLIRQKR
ncbi:MAG: GntR family transcriptional regulator [Alphaproteobacteria bacterium]|nr:MAG: GntR family transcriptional regulator [Alphaproteobacteria bacterium]